MWDEKSLWHRFSCTLAMPEAVMTFVSGTLTERGKQPHIFHYKAIITCKPIKAIRTWISDLGSQIPAMKNPIRGHVFNLHCQPCCLLHIYDTFTKTPLTGIFSFQEANFNTKQFPWISQKYGKHPVRNPNNPNPLFLRCCYQKISCFTLTDNKNFQIFK